MARKWNSNKLQTSATRPNNRRGRQGANFDEDYPMGGVDSSTTKHNKSQPGRRGQNICHPAHGQSLSPRHGDYKTNPRDQYSHNNRNLHRNAQGHKANIHADGNPNTRRNRRRHRGPASLDDDNIDLDEKAGIDTHDPPFPSLRCTNSGVYKNKNSNMRYCTECSSVRRANLRFRNWAARALNHCNQQFAAWSEDAGVGFDTYDEMDWQPEPRGKPAASAIGSLPETWPLGVAALVREHLAERRASGVAGKHVRG
ncbi:uncharacterized protein F4812DRAFT_104655 [Daldinia caldariorum]|uniref:uncharacterized protein n=1 Tax=Daldinia caldariorum TaxID=326644 RepID=UPI002007DF0B|nr:uncharacterized protein F4812DRAFT_104655 [Daldinia caldariorum]KAI1465622.1 hypothetical protein F4812DRAFT_104655 [Daldinia caldariorum]